MEINFANTRSMHLDALVMARGEYCLEVVGPGDAVAFVLVRGCLQITRQKAGDPASYCLHATPAAPLIILNPGIGANGTPNQAEASNPPEARGAETRAPQTPPQAPLGASPEPTSSQHSEQTPPPPDFTPEAVEASAPRRAPAAPPTLDLPPPTPPSLVRADEQAVTLERVLADHRAQLAKQTEVQQAQHAAMMEGLLAEHRRAQAEANLEHRQQLADLLARHREDVQRASGSTDERDQALHDLRELLTEQAKSMQAEHARVGDKIESIVDIVGMVGETVHHLAAVALQPKAPLFGSLPQRPVDTHGATDRPMPPPTAGAPRVLPLRHPAPLPTTATATVQPSVDQTSPAAPQPAATPATQISTAPQPPSAAPAARREPGPAPVEPHPAPTGRVATGASTSTRSTSFIPATTEITSTHPSARAPRQRRAEEAARERSRLDEAISDLTLDDETGDGPDASEVLDV